MRKWLVALVLLTACGPGSAQPIPSLPPPSPPTAALTAWKDFPANANPRPIIVFDRTLEHIGPAGFTTEPDRKRDCGWGLVSGARSGGSLFRAHCCARWVCLPGISMPDGATLCDQGRAVAGRRLCYRPRDDADVRMALRHQRDRRLPRVLGSRAVGFLGKWGQPPGHDGWPDQRRRLDTHARYGWRPRNPGTVR